MLFPKESLLVFFSNGKIAHHVKPNLSGLKNLLLESDFKRGPKAGRNSKPLMSSGFMLLGAEYFYPVYQNIKNGKPNLPLYFEAVGPIYFKGTRLVNNYGEIVIPYYRICRRFLNLELVF